MNSQALHRGQPFDLSDIAGDLQQVEAAIEASLTTSDKFVHEVSTYYLKAGGKRIRPALVLLASQFPKSLVSQVLPVAAAVELIHMATLVHDDVVDNASLRRGLPTVNAKWSNQVSVLTGDYLFAKSFSLLSQTGDNRLVRIMADVVYEMSQGELRQIATYFDVDQSEQDYLHRIAQKTAFLIAECCRLGAICGGADEAQVQALYDYGMNVGMSFQIADDLLDFHGNSRTTGKPVAEDLRCGILTMPVIHALAHSPRSDELRGIINARNMGEAEVAKVHEYLEAAGSFEYARNRARTYLNRACDALDKVPDLRSQPTLLLLAEFVINRQF